jgi:hypothetical protein
MARRKPKPEAIWQQFNPQRHYIDMMVQYWKKP